VSAVYALRRGGNRQETLCAVDNLIQLCNFGGELCLPAVKQMMAAGKMFFISCIFIDDYKRVFVEVLANETLYTLHIFDKISDLSLLITHILFVHRCSAIPALNPFPCI